MQVLKQRFSRTRHESEVWEVRYYDFNVRTEDKHSEKLHYIHQNPVRRGLVSAPGDWPWSSSRAYTLSEPSTVTIFKPWQSFTRAPHYTEPAREPA